MKEAGVFPHTSQSGSAFKGRSTDAAAEEAGEDAEAGANADTDAGADANADADADADADSLGEEEVAEEEGTDNDGNVEVDGPSLAALGCFPPFFFVMGWCVGPLELDEQ